MERTRVVTASLAHCSALTVATPATPAACEEEGCSGGGGRGLFNPRTRGAVRNITIDTILLTALSTIYIPPTYLFALIEKDKITTKQQNTRQLLENPLDLRDQ